MSYDLYLYPRKGKRMPTRERFFAHFGEEHTERVEDEVHYSNPNTGVYFHFAYQGAGSASDNPNTGGRAHIYFNLNYFRPHYFGLEAESVLTPLVQAFGLTVDDPQADGMGQGDYSAEGFLRGWNTGNRFAASAMRELGGATPGTLSLPMERNRRLWAWNFDREELVHMQHFDLIDTYVPPVWLCEEAGQARTFCLFPNLVPTTVPKVDYVMVTRDELAGPYAKKSKKTPAWVTWDELRAVAQGFDEVCGEGEDEEELDHLVLFSDEYQNMETAPAALAKWVIGLPRWPGKPVQVRPDMVLDAELLTG